MPNEPRRQSTTPADLALPNAPGLPKRSEASCLTITIVGVLGDDTPDHDRLVRIGAEIQVAIEAAFPGFKPGYPPISVSFTTLPELRKPDAEG